MRGLDRSHTGLPVLVAQGVSHCVGFGSCAEQTTEICVGLEVTDREEHQASEEDHSLSYLFIVSSPTRTSLQEENEIGNVVGHLGSRGRGAVFIFDESVDQLPRHTDDHVIEIAELLQAYGLKCLPLGTSSP